MDRELGKKLADEFVFMRVERTYGADDFIDNLFYAFGCECGDGWYQLIHDLCSEIQSIINKYGGDSMVYVQQVKEKYAGLRFYFASKGGEEFHAEVSDVINKYEELSYETCEVCGAKGEVRGGGWLQCRCDNCEAENQWRRKDWLMRHQTESK